MGALHNIAGRISNRTKLTGGMTAGALAPLLVVTIIPAGLIPTGGSAALAELLARSPGERTGGVALKAKQRRAAVAPLAGGPAEAAPANAFASVLGTSAGPEGAVPAAPAATPGGFPAEFLAPEAPVEALAPPADTGVTPGIPPLPGSPFVPLPSLLPPLPTPEATGTVPVVEGVPEPTTWVLLIVGFGAVGQAARRRQRLLRA